MYEEEEEELYEEEDELYEEEEEELYEEEPEESDSVLKDAVEADALVTEEDKTEPDQV